MRCPALRVAKRVKVERNVGDGGVVKGGPSSDFVKCSGGVCEDWGGRVLE